MTLIPQLEAELVELAKRTAAASSAPTRHWRSVPVLAAVIALALGAAALAASGLIGNGKPLEPPRGAPLKPDAWLGVPQVGKTAVLKTAVPDPAGGPPWGLRFVATTRGLGCLQVGRLVRGDIGVLGQDGAFANDGRFHRLADNYFGSIAGPFPCGALDVRGHAFAGIYAHGVPAGGLVVPSAEQPGCILRLNQNRSRRHQPPACPAKDWRILTLGMAGPEAKSVTYVSAGRTHTIPTVGDQGAYLIVQPVSARARGLGSFAPLEGAGGGPIVRIDYRNGYVCRIRSRFPSQRICPPVGRVLPATPHLTTTHVASPVTARIGKGHFGRTVLVSFVARIPVKDASAAYVLTLRFSGPHANCRATAIGPLLRNVRAGQRVHFHEPTNGCRGIFRGRVAYRYSLNGDMPPFAPRGAHELTVGTFRVDAR
jgi:hypothetical protein